MNNKLTQCIHRIKYDSAKSKRSELPCNGWDGWHMHSGMLWSPEGHGFKPNDSSWWGLLVRQARSFKTMYDREALLKQLAIRAGDGVTATGGAGSAGTPAAGTPPPSGGVVQPVGKGGSAVTPPFFPDNRNFCYKFKQFGMGLSGGFGGGK